MTSVKKISLNLPFLIPENSMKNRLPSALFALSKVKFPQFAVVEYIFVYVAFWRVST